MTEREVRIWLDRGRKIAVELDALKLAADRNREYATGFSRPFTGVNVGSMPKNRSEDSLVRLIDSDERLRECREESDKIFNEISRAIAKLDDGELRAVLTYRYILLMNPEKIAEILHYSTRTVYYKIRLAVQKLCSVFH